MFSPSNFAEMLRNASETSNAFVLVGLANGSPISTLGVLTLFFEEWPQMLADIVVGAVTVSTVSFRVDGREESQPGIQSAQRSQLLSSE